MTDDELRGLLLSAVRTGIRGYREADLMLAKVCADQLLNRLRLASIVMLMEPALTPESRWLVPSAGDAKRPLSNARWLQHGSADGRGS